MRLAPVSALSAATSSIFSSVVRGSPPPGKRPKRVPPVPTAHDGAATENRGDLVDDRVGVDAAAAERARQRGRGRVSWAATRPASMLVDLLGV